MTRHRITTALVAVLALGATGLSGCGRGDTEAAGDSEGAADLAAPVTLALSTQTNPFFVQVRDGALERAAELGVDLNVQDAGDDALKQADQLNTAIATKAGVVLVNPVDSDAVGSSVVKLNDRDIPVVGVDRTANSGTLTSYVASDNVSGGRQAADALARAIGNRGKIIILQGVAGSSSSRDRGRGFREQIATYPDIEVVAEQTAGFDRTKGLDVATNLLQAHPDIVGIFAENDEMALGAIEAVGQRAGRDIHIVGFDGTAEGLAAVEEHRMTATIAQQPRELGAVAVDQARELLLGRDVDAVVPVPVVTVTTENLGEFL